MINTKEYGGNQFQIRGLTRGEIKALRKKGYNMTNLRPEDSDIIADEMVSIVLNDDAVNLADDLLNSDYLKLFKDILELTYGSSKSEKNLSTSGDGKTADA